MLRAEQVYPFLIHENAEIRLHALHYFVKGHERSPMTAEDVWAVVDRFGWEASLHQLSHLRDLPETPRSTERLIEALGSREDVDAQVHLTLAAMWLPLDAARRIVDDASIKRHLLPEAVQHINARIALADKPLEAVWSALEEHIVRLERAASFDAPVQLTSQRLTEALARFPDEAAARALVILNDAKLVGSWRASLAVQMFERIRNPDALEPLLRVVADDGGEYNNERAVEALVHLGTTEVVDAVAARFPEGTSAFRAYAPDVLGRIRRPEAEAAILRLLEGERDFFARTVLATELCEMCTTEGLEVIRAMVVEDDYDMTFADLDELLLTVGAMQGYEPPEAIAWRARIADREAQAAERKARIWPWFQSAVPAAPPAGRKPRPFVPYGKKAKKKRKKK